MGKVIILPMITKLDIPPDRVLEAAIGKLDGVFLMGYTKEEQKLYMASSYADGGLVLWMMEAAKVELLKAGGILSDEA